MSKIINDIEKAASDLAVALGRAADKIDASDGGGLDDATLEEAVQAAREMAGDLNMGDLDCVIGVLETIEP